MKPEKLFENGPEWAGSNGWVWQCTIGGIEYALYHHETAKWWTAWEETADDESPGHVTLPEAIDWIRARVVEHTASAVEAIPAAELVAALGESKQCELQTALYKVAPYSKQEQLDDYRKRAYEAEELLRKHLLPIDCPDCEGVGHSGNYLDGPCETCGGWNNEKRERVAQCPRCKGQGWVDTVVMGDHDTAIREARREAWASAYMQGRQDMHRGEWTPNPHNNEENEG